MQDPWATLFLEADGQMLFDFDPLDTSLVPDECVRYIEDPIAEYNPIARIRVRMWPYFMNICHK